MSAERSECDVLVVGGGPIGLEVAASLRTAGVDALVVEAGAIGQTMTWWAPQTRFFSSPERIEICGTPLVVPGQEKATGEEYIDYLRGVVSQHGIPVRTHERVTGFGREGGVFVATTEGPGGAAEITAKKVVLASGNMDEPRRLGVPGEDLPSVSHYFKGPHYYYGRKVLIVGGKNSACEAALRLYRAGVDVSISYRGPRFDPDRVKYWIRPELEWLIGKGKIGFMHCTRPVAIEPGRVRLTRVLPAETGECPDAAALHDGQQESGEDSASGGLVQGDHPDTALWRRAGADFDVGCDFVLLMTGYVQDKGLFEMLGIDLMGDERRPVYERETMETNVPGVFVAGTACGGSQKRARVFIETSHVHAERITAAVTGERTRAEAPAYGRFEES